MVYLNSAYTVRLPHYFSIFLVFSHFVARLPADLPSSLVSVCKNESGKGLHVHGTRRRPNKHFALHARLTLHLQPTE